MPMRQCFLSLLWLCAGPVALAQEPAAAVPEPSTQEARAAQRAHVLQEQQAVAAELARQEAACYRQFAVEDCLRRARSQAHAQDMQLRGQLRQIEGEERRERARQRLLDIEAQQRTQQERLQSDAENAPAPQVRKPAPAPAAQAQPSQDRAAEKAAEKALRRAQLDERAERARERQQETVRQAEERQQRKAQQQAEDAAAGRVPAAPLPPRPGP